MVSRPKVRYKDNKKGYVPITIDNGFKPLVKISNHYNPEADVTLYLGDCRDLLGEIPDQSAQLIITSPPYNIGKEYEKRIPLDEYVQQQAEIIDLCIRKLSPRGSICWEVGNYIFNGEIAPLDIVLYPIFKKHGLMLRNRIIWHFEHGLHCSKRLSGRHEAILWFTKSDDYIFNLDTIRVPQKYPGKTYFRGPKYGLPSGNPLGKNPGDVWVFPNVKANHPEKTLHPCQFPVELVERFVLSLTEPGALVIDPFIGVGTTAIGAILHKRKAAGADIVPEYIQIACQRIYSTAEGKLAIRPMGQPVYQATGRERITKVPSEWKFKG